MGGGQGPPGRRKSMVTDTILGEGDRRASPSGARQPESTLSTIPSVGSEPSASSAKPDAKATPERSTSPNQKLKAAFRKVVGLSAFSSKVTKPETGGEDMKKTLSQKLEGYSS